MAEPPYLVEVMPHIGVVQLFVYVGEAPPQNLNLALRPRELELSFKSPAGGSDERMQLLLGLPLEMKSDSAVLKQMGPHLVARISLLQKTTEPEDDAPPPVPPLSHFQGLRCRFCLAPILRNDIAKATSQPSAHWQELADLWICHRTFFDVVPIRDVKPQPHVIVLGESSALVHEGDVLPGALRLNTDDVSKEHTSAPAACARCHLPLGNAAVVHTESNPPSPTISFSEVQLFYHALASNASPNAFGPFTIETLTALTMRDAARDHQCFRFLVAGFESKRVYILLQLLSKGVLFSSNACSPFVKTPLRAQKVLFFDCTLAGSEGTLQSWLSASETIVMLDDECADLLRTLRERNAATPAAMQTLGLMRTSWLLEAQRLSP